MRTIIDKIERVHYTSFTYNSVDEKNQHIVVMREKGYEFLVNFEDKLQAAFRKFL